MRHFHRRNGRTLLGAALVGGLLAGCGDFIESPTGDPNAVPVPQLDQLLTATQVNSFFVNGGELSRLASIWIQQVLGADRQFSSYDNYIITEDVGDDTWGNIYRSGGLNEIRQGIALAETQNRPVVKGIFQIHQAFLIGTAASVWGDVPFSEAVTPGITEPKLDPQPQVYAQLQAMLDNAIQNLQTNQGRPTAGVDLNFNGDPQKWTAVANSLKARLYMHWVEAQLAGGQSAQLAQTACGGNCIQKAFEAAQKGVSSPANNWKAIHTTTSTENNLWYQFQRDRSGYIEPNAVLVTLLTQRNDPRRDLYFDKVNEAGTEANEIRIPATQDFDMPIVSCAETQFIEAEAAARLGRTDAALAAYREGLKCQESFWNIKLADRSAGLSGNALLNEIALQKYIALFLNPEIWNDYKRTCTPNIVPKGTIAGRRQVPPGLYYPISERQTNPKNIPAATPETLRNQNDPNPCT